MRTSFALALVAGFVGIKTMQADEPFPLKDGDRVLLVGNALIEHERFHGMLETTLRRHAPNAKVTFRNLGWSGDTVRGEARTSGFQNPEGLARLLKEAKAQKATVLILGYGMNESFAGDPGLPAFIKGYEKLLDDLGPLPARTILLSPTWHENLGPPFPDPAEHNRSLEKYVAAVRDLASRRKWSFIDLYEPLARAKKTAPDRPLTSNGLLLNERGYWHVARAIESGLALPGDGVVLRISPDRKVEAVRLASLPQPGAAPPKSIALSVENLPPGRHVVAFEGKRLGVVDAKQPSLDVPAQPFLDDVETLRKAIVVRDDLFFRGWRPFNDHSRHWHFMAKDFELFAQLTTRQDEAIDSLRLGRIPSLEVTPE